MVDSINIRTQLAQIESVQKVQQLAHKETDLAQQHTANKMVANKEHDQRQVVSSHKAEEDRVKEKKESDGGQQQEKKEKRPPKGSEEKNASSGPGDGEHIDIKV